MYIFSKDEVLDILILAETDCGGDKVLALNIFFNRQCTPEEYSNFTMKLRDFRWGFVQINQNIRNFKKKKKEK